jgi:hypothetical protein
LSTSSRQLTQPKHVHPTPPSRRRDLHLLARPHFSANVTNRVRVNNLRSQTPPATKRTCRKNGTSPCLHVSFTNSYLLASFSLRVHAWLTQPPRRVQRYIALQCRQLSLWQYLHVNVASPSCFLLRVLQKSLSKRPIIKRVSLLPYRLFSSC